MPDLHVSLCTLLCVAFFQSSAAAGMRRYVFEKALPQRLLTTEDRSTIFDSGQPPDKYETGGIVWAGQTLGVRFVQETPLAWNRQSLISNVVVDSWVVDKVRFFVEADRVMLGEQGIVLMLCQSLTGSGLPDGETCLSESFSLRRIHQIEAEWRPTSAFTIKGREAVWFMVQGNATVPEHSFSWLDGSLSSWSGGARSAYVDMYSGKLVFDSLNSTLPSLQVVAASSSKESAT